MIPYRPPKFREGAFNCPHCNAYADQTWKNIWAQARDSDMARFHRMNEIGDDLQVAFCTHCGNYTLWHFQKMIYPEDTGARPPNLDLREDIKEDYLEAKSITNKSPRGAAAILRLCIQKLCEQLGEKGKNLNDDIASLVRKGLPVKIQEALDVVRVIGNNAVHPGQIDIKDDRDTAMKLFELVNLIAYDRITHPKEVDKLYESLPESQLEAIQKRDKGGLASSNAD